MKNMLIKLLSILSLFGCSNNIKNEIYLYNTEEYNNFLKDVNISLKDAEEIVCDAISNNIIKSSDDIDFDKNINFRYMKRRLVHYFIIDNNYIFLNYFPNKLGIYDISNSLKVNVYTGKLEQYVVKERKLFSTNLGYGYGYEYLLKCKKNDL